MTAVTSLDSQLDAIAIVRTVIRDDHDAQRVILDGVDTVDLTVSLALFAAQLVTAMNGLDSEAAAAWLDGWQRDLIAEGNR